MKGAKLPAEVSAVSLIDECIEYSDRGVNFLSAPISQRVTAILSLLVSKGILYSNTNEIGDLIASLAEFIPINNAQYIQFCDSIANVCIDREFVTFSDEALATLCNITLNHLETKPQDVSAGLRAISTVLYHNTSRLISFHNRIIDISSKISTVSEESHRRACVVFGNLTAFSNKSLDRTTYTRSLKFLMNSLSHKGVELLKSALRSMQLLILDSPVDILDIPAITHISCDMVFKNNPSALKYEGIMVLKALANSTKNAFYSQWQSILTRTPSIFDLVYGAARNAKAAAELLADIFRGSWHYMYIANNIEKTKGFTTLAAQVGDIIDISFNRFLMVLSQTQNKIDQGVYNRLAKSFSVFIKNCSFDSGRLKNGYIEKIVDWGMGNIDSKPEETLMVLKSLLWTKIEFKPFSESFGFLFDSFLKNITGKNADIVTQCSVSLRRIAYAYPKECIARWSILGPCLKSINPVHSIQIIIRLAENQVRHMQMWEDLFSSIVPSAFESGSTKAIQLSLQAFGLCGYIFEGLPDGLRRQCLSTVLSNDCDEAYEAIGNLVQTKAPEYSSVFLSDSYRKLVSASPPRLKPLSKTLAAFSLRYKDQFDSEWLSSLYHIITHTPSHYQALCIAYLLPLIPKDHELLNHCLVFISDVLANGEIRARWKAAKAISIAFNLGFVSESALVLLFDYIKEAKSPKLRVRSSEAMSSVPSRHEFGELFIPLIRSTIELALIPVHFANLKLDEQRKYDSSFRLALVSNLFRMLKWTTSRDFVHLEDILIPNSESVFQMFEEYPDSPWVQITTLYEAKFGSIPSSLLERYQEKAFPV